MRRPEIALPLAAVVAASAVVALRPAPASAETPPAPTTVQELSLPDASNARPARLAARGTQPFALLGLSWPKQSGDVRSASVRLRVDGSWTGWQRLSADYGHDEDGKGRDGTDPLWVGRADGVQAVVTAQDGSPVHGVKITLVDPGADSQAVLAGPAPAGRPPIVSRRAWGADESLRDDNPGCGVPEYTTTIKAAFVHHTAGTNSYTAAQSAALIRAIYAFHVKGRGWCDLGYNFLVDKFGRIFEGRYGGVHVPVLGAHTGGHNQHSFGVSLMGDFTRTEPSAASMESAARVIAWKLDGHYRNPRGTTTLVGKRFNVISGHRDAKATECPGARVYARLPWLRSRVLALMGGGYSTEIHRFAQALGGEVKVGGAWWLEHPVPGGRGTWFVHRDIYWSPYTGAHSVFGAFRVLHRRLGDASGVLGLPRAEQRTNGASAEQHFLRNGAGQGAYWSRATGAHEVLSAIYVRYGTGTVRSSLGLPTAGQARARLAGAWVQRFRTGRIYWSAQTGAWEIHGPIQAGYDRVGAETSRLGLPRSTLYAVSGGLAQNFTGGRIAWNTTTGAITITYNG